MFAIKNAMIDIPANFSSKCETKCECGMQEDMNHIYECELFSEKRTKYHLKKYSMVI